jgi:hypothetical protein
MDKLALTMKRRTNRHNKKEIEEPSEVVTEEE